jgi:SAM-dependent methyltransferase
MDVLDRAKEGRCLCCLADVKTQPTLTSAFLSHRAWGGGVEWSSTSKCTECGFAFHGRGLRADEVASYYRGYRDEEYFRSRNSYEPFYTRKVHDTLDDQMGGPQRRAALRNYLSRFSIASAGQANEIKILDYGGGKGRLISELAGRKFVYDLSGEAPVSGVVGIPESVLHSERFDLVVCAQMIEHATDPFAVATELMGLLKPGGHLYIEVPYDETWRDLSLDGWLRLQVLALAKKSRSFNTAWDIYGTAFRVKMKVLPPLAFVPVREHLNYFTPESLSALGKRAGGDVVDASRVALLGTTLLLRKRSQ